MRTTQDYTTAAPSISPAPESERPSPDHELLRLWHRFCELIAAGRNLHGEAFDRISDEMAEIENLLKTMTAATPEGVAVLLRVGFMRRSYSDEMATRYVSGRVAGPAPADLDPLLWRALVSIDLQIVKAAGRQARSRRSTPSRSGAR